MRHRIHRNNRNYLLDVAADLDRKRFNAANAIAIGLAFHNCRIGRARESDIQEQLFGFSVILGINPM